MNIQKKLATFQTQVHREISNNILPFYLTHTIDHQHDAVAPHNGRACLEIMQRIDRLIKM